MKSRVCTGTREFEKQQPYNSAPFLLRLLFLYRIIQGGAEFCPRTNMDADVDNVHRKPSYEELLRVMQYIARYKGWDFETVREPWKWCNEFVAVADQCLQGEKVLV